MVSGFGSMLPERCGLVPLDIEALAIVLGEEITKASERGMISAEALEEIVDRVVPDQGPAREVVRESLALVLPHMGLDWRPL